MTNFLFSTTKAGLLTLVLIGAMQLTGFAQVGVTITPVGPLCAGSNLSITTSVSGGIAPYGYSWSGPNGFLSSDANPTRTSIGTALSGSFSVTVTSSDGLTGTASTNITVNDVLASISVTPSSSVCSYQTLTINAAGGGTYLWNTGATSASINPTTTGLYAVTVTRNGCSARVCQNVTVTNVVASINASASTITCTTPSTTLTASGGNTYQWSNGLGTNSVVTASPSVNTTYTVTATGPNGCTSTASVAIVVDNANPIASITPSAATINCTTTSATLTASGGGTYAWNNGLGSSATVSITPTVSTNYIVTVTAANGCTATANSSITVNQTPPFAGISPASGTLTCNTTSITFTATSVAGATFLWQDGTTNNTFVASSAGTVSVTMRDPSNGCTATASASVNANNTPPSPALTGPTNSCVGSNASYTLGTSFTSYAWSVTGGTIASGGNSTSNAVSVSWATAGTGRVEVTVTGSNGCTASTSYNVTVANSISLSNITTACNILGTNYTLGFDITGGQVPYTVTGVGGSITSNTFTSVTISQGAPVTVTVSSGSGCQAVTLTRTQTCTPPSACVPNTGCLGTNLVVDGNFESFNVSQGASSPFNNFTSNFAYQSLATLNSSPCSISSTPILCAYRFGVATSPTPYNPTWSSNVRDHTTGNGNMMILDYPAGNVSPNNNIWCQTVTLAPASTFCFGTYAINLLPTGSNQPLPVFRFTANGNTLGISQAVPESEQWGFYGYTFNSGAGGPTQLCIANNNFGAVGYDLAIDDISIRQQLPGTPPTAIDDLALLCANSNATVGNVLTNDQPNGSSITSVRVIVAPAFTDGRVTLTNSGDFTFVRDASFTTGSTTFDYEICHTSGCCDIGRVTITNANNPTITVSPNSFVLNCTATAVTVTANGGTTYLWNGGQSTNTLVINAPGTYTVTGTNASGCTASASVSVTQDIAAPTVTIAPSSFVLNCTTTAVTATANGANSYVWGAGQTTGSININSPNTYTVTGTNTANGCTASANTVVTQDIAAPTVTLSPSSFELNCTATVATINASGADTYSWTGGQTTAAATFNSAGVYTVVGTSNSNGCTASANVSITQNVTAPTVTLSPTNFVLNCTTTSTTVTASGADSYVWSSGETTPSVVYSTAGEFTVTGTNAANGCTSSAAVTITQNNSAPSAFVNASSALLTCSNTSITITAGSLVANPSYDWGGGNINPVLVVNAPGNYIVTVTDNSNGCTSTASRLVNQNVNAPTVTVAPNSFELNCTTTSVTVTASGASAYAWSTGETTASVVYNAPGVYTVTGTNTTNGCTASANTTVTQNVTAPALTVAPASFELNCTATAVTVTASGASSYAWSTGETTARVVYNTPGVYSVTGTDNANGCTSSNNMTVTQNITAPALVIAPTIFELNCTATAVTVTASGASAYAWSTGETTANVVYNTLGVYTVTGTDTANGCTASANVTVTQDITAPTVTVAPNTFELNCTATSVTVTASGANDYSWSTSETTASVVYNTPGVYAVIGTDNANGCTTSANVTVTQNITAPAVVVTPSAFQLNCTATSVTVTASGASTYAWSTGETTSNVVYNAAGVYSVTGTDNANGCTSSNNVTVTQDITAPTVVVAPTTFVLDCTNTAITATASGAVSYLWDGGQTSATLAINAAGVYGVTGTSANGCTASANISVTQNTTPPSATINATSGLLTCANTSITLTAGSFVANPSYNWGAGNTSTALVVNAPGNYIVTITDNDNGCTATASRNITQDITAPTVTVAPNSFVLNCTATAVTVTASGANTYAWSTGETTASVVYNTSGVRTVIGTDNANGCTASANVTVTQNITAPALVVTPSTFQLNCTATSVTVTASGASTYAWSTGEATASVVYNAPGVYSVTGTDNANGCTSSNNVTVTQDITAPTVVVAPTTFVLDCTNTAVSATASGAVSYLWDGGQTSATLAINAAGVYGVTGTSANGCTASANISVTQNATPPSATINATSGLLTCANTSITLTAGSFVANPSYNWGAGNTSTTLVVNAPGNYIVTITDNDNGCTATALRNITQDITAPTVTVAPATFVLNCTATAVTVTASGASTYAWSTGETTASVVYNTPGVRTVIGTNNTNGCTASANVTVTQNITAPALVVTPSTFQLNCTATSVTVTASGASTYAWSTGEATASVVYNAPGVYSVIGTDNANGCTSSNNVTVTQDITAPTVAVAPTTFVLNCNNTAVTATASGAVSYLWDGGQTSATLAMNAAGVYGVTGTAANGCTASANISVTQNTTPPSATINATAGLLTCANTSITLTAGSFVANPSYNWGSGNTSTTLVVNAPGNYIVTITDNDNGCTATASRNITQDITAPTVTVAPATFILNCTATTVTVTASGASTYAWSTGETTASVVYNTPGVRNVIGTNNTNGCTASANVTVTQNITAPSLVVTPATFQLNCTATSVTVTASGASTYAWSTGETTSNVVYNAAGVYSVTGTDNANGCTTSANVTVTQNITAPTVVVAPSTFQLNCTATAVTVTASGGNTYTWSTGQTTASVVYNTPGVRTVIGTNNTNGCTASANVTITQDITAPAVVVTPSTFQLNCTATSVTVTASGASTYAWSTGETTASVVYNTPGVRTVVGTNNTNGCTASANVTVTQDITTPTVAVSPSTFVLNCITTNTNIVASGASNYAWSNGGLSASINVSAAGIYTVTGTNTANGCNATASATVTLDNTPPVANITPSAATLDCTNPTTTLTATGGGAYLWPDGSSSNTLTVNASNQYTVTVTVANGCTATATSNVGANFTPPTPSITQSSPSFTCLVTNITLTANGGGSYLWSDATNGNTIVATTPGLYSLTVTAANGCTASTSVNIGGSTLQVTATVAVTNVQCTGQCNGRLSISPANGIAPYTFLWSNGQTTQTATGLCVGNFNYTVTDTNGCRFIGAASVGQPASPLSVNANTNTIGTCGPVCNGSALAVATGGTLPYTFLWSNGETVTNASALCAGDAFVTVTDANGCTALGSTNVPFRQTNQPTIFSNLPVCEGQRAEFRIDPYNGQTVTYVWGFNGSAIGFNANSNNFAVSRVGLDSSGVYSVTVIVDGCPSAPATVLLVAGELPTITTVTGGGLFCEGVSATLNAVTASMATSTSLTYGWTGPSNFNRTVRNDGSLVFPALTLSQSGRYTVQVTTSQGCVSDPYSVDIQVQPIPAAPVLTLSDAFLCEGEMLMLSTTPLAVANPVYEWFLNGTPIGGTLVPAFVVGSVSSTDAGRYQLRVNANGCFSPLSANSLVTVSTAPAVTPTVSSPVCVGAPVNFSAGFSAGLTYDWSGPLGFSGNTASPGIASASVAQSGTYYLVATDRATGCATTASVTLQVNATPATPAAANSGPACAGSSVDLTLAQGGTFGATYTWVDATTGATIGTSTAANGLLSTSLPAGTYNFAVYASVGGCSGGTSQPTSVTVRPAGTATAFAGPDFGLCGNTSTILTAFAPQGVSGIWSTTGSATIASPTSPNSPVTGLVVGVNRFTWTLTGCDNGSDILEIIVSDPVLDRAFAGSDQSLCGGVTTANLAARATSAGVPGRWDQVSGPLATIANQNTPSTVVTGLQPGRNVFVWSVNGGACGQDSRDSVVLEVVIPLVVSATNDSYTMAPSTPSLNGQSVAGNDAFPNNAVFTLISGTSQGTLGFRGDGSFDYARSSSTLDYTETFTYRVCASDACGTYCATATVVVSVEGTNPLVNPTDCPFIPNIITPNGDNVNDALVVRCAGDLFSNGVEINIFNRYGDEVFSSKDYHSDWQGTFNSEPLPPGTYYYIVKTPRSTDTVKGFFVIQR